MFGMHIYKYDIHQSVIPLPRLLLRHDEQTFTTLSDVSVMASGRFGRKFSDGSDGALLSQVIEAHHGADQADCCS